MEKKRKRLTDGLTPATLSGGTVRIALPSRHAALVDEADWPLVRDRRWYSFPVGRKEGKRSRMAVSEGPNRRTRTRELLHRVVLGIPVGDRRIVDFANGDRLDCRRANLIVSVGRGTSIGAKCRRKAATSRGGRVTSRYIGVSRMVNKRKSAPHALYWQARISVGGRQRYIGVWPFTRAGERAAAEAYDDMARLHQGPHATLNFPRRGERSARTGMLRR